MPGSVFATYSPTDFAIVKGEGARVWADNGREYLDFGAGIAVNNLGHAHPHLVEALNEQAGKLWHVSNLYRIPGQERLAERLTGATFADRVFFCNSGAEAIECAIKTTRKYQAENGHPERFRIVTFEGAFHGRTLATIAAGGQEKYLAGFGPKVEGFDQVPFEDLDAVRAAVTGETAGILIEPVQGEGGIRPVSREFLRQLRKICDDNGLLLIFDEVQCGMGRTGTLFAYEQTGVTPDILGTAKGIGGGFPFGACLATENAASGMTVGSHASTFGGNPLACAVGNAVLDVMLEDGFLELVREKARNLNQKLAGLVGSHPDVFEGITGEGLMLGLKCKVPVGDLMNATIAHGLLTVAAGNNVLRLVPPLVVTEDEIDEAVKLLDEAACELEAESVGA